MSSSNAEQPSQQVKSPESKILIQKTSDPDTKTAEFEENPAENKTTSVEDPERSTEDGEADAGGDEEEGECGFCLFMKGGGCKETFVEWEKCVEEAENNQEDIVEKCFQVTAALKKCMEAHSDYYAPILQAEKAAEAEAEASKQLGEEKDRLNNQGGGGQESEKKDDLGGSDPKK